MSALDILSKHPFAGAPVAGGVRRILLARYPYALIYTIEKQRLVVLAVAHLKREPNYWTGRLAHD